ncbi:hypothetical protein BD779DRAFT_1578404 [Infundibulicybe gibba]|nr:hypothetical protein BD779DRAFT_1578404 [Infundibulicybe gibba]
MTGRQREPSRPSPPVRCVVHDLSPEVLGEIFLHCLPPDEWGSFSACDAPWLLTKVCQSWRELALSTPLLWSRLPSLKPWRNSNAWPLDERKDQGDGHLRLLELHLKNSMGTALSLEFEVHRSTDNVPFLPLVALYLSRVQHLKIVDCYEFPWKEFGITHKHFPLLKSLELVKNPMLAPRNWQRLPPWTAPLEGVEFPWAQLTQLTIQVTTTFEAIMVLRDCCSLETCCFSPSLPVNPIREPPRTPPESKMVCPRLQMFVMDSGPFVEGLLGCLMTPALSALKFTHKVFIEHKSSVALRSLLPLVENSSAKLTSLILSDVECSLQDFIDLSSLTPTISELDLGGLSEESLQPLSIKSDSPYGVLFPCLKRLIIRNPAASESMLLDMFHSRLYLAPNPNIIENTSTLQHAELYTSLFDRHMPTYFDESGLEDAPELRRLIAWLRSTYASAVWYDRGTPDLPLVPEKVMVLCASYESFPEKEELGYCEGTLPTAHERFFQKLDAVFTVLETYRFTHAVEILKNRTDMLIRGFSCVPETALLHHPTYQFHTRATNLLKRWQPMLSEYCKARDNWVYEYGPTPGMFKLVHRRLMYV